MNRFIYVAFGIIFLVAIGLYLLWRGAEQTCESVVDEDPRPTLLFSVDQSSLPAGVAIDDSQPFLLFITNTTAVDLYLLTPEQWAAYPENKQTVLDVAVSIPPGKNLSAIPYEEWSEYMQSLMAPAAAQPQLYLVAEGEPLAVPYSVGKVPDPNLDPAAVQRAEECLRLEEEPFPIVAEEPVSNLPAREKTDTAVAVPWLLLVISLLVVGLLMARAVFKQKRKT